MDNAVKERRFRMVLITPELLQQLMTQGWRIPNSSFTGIECMEGLPEDAIYVGAVSRPMFGMGLIFAHPTWEQHTAAYDPPTMHVVYKTEFEPVE